MSVKFYLDKSLFTKEYTETGINYTALKAVHDRKETDNEFIDFNDTIWDHDIPEIVDTLIRMNEKKFTVSSGFSGLVKTLAGFERYGASVTGLTEVNSTHRDFETREFERVPALAMEIKQFLRAEYISYMHAYRIYDPAHPQQTIAYEDDEITAEKRAKEEGYAGIIICDSDTMHVECY